ncbi:MAG: DUF3786 domain-containing protein [Desulfobacterales bacterium]|nr:DUF3786 domain-containing protein [Desulfobacterales bacterium]
MIQPKNIIDILKLLDKSNCRECYETTCMAFAAAVFKGQKSLNECTRLKKEIIEKYDIKIINDKKIDDPDEESLKKLKEKIYNVDFSSSAERIGAQIIDNKLIIKVLGKDIIIDSKGNISSDIHLHIWVTIPILSYILSCKGIPISKKWISLRELKNGNSWYGLFVQRCEKPLKKVADNYTELFEDMVHIFKGKKEENHYEADISVVLYPLPKVPILICYWKPEDELESSLNIFFDSTAEENLGIEAIYGLIAGIVRMFEKIALRHGFKND